MVRALSRLQTDNLTSVCVKSSAQKDFTEWVQSRMPHLVWPGPCNSWCERLPSIEPSTQVLSPLMLDMTDKNSNSKVIVPWPGTMLHYYAATKIVRWKDFGLECEDPSDKFGGF